MERIVRVHHPHLEQRLLDVALDRFFAIRKVAGLRKPPSTSELVDWLTVLVHAGLDPGGPRLAVDLDPAHPLGLDHDRVLE